MTFATNTVVQSVGAAERGIAGRSSRIVEGVARIAVREAVELNPRPRPHAADSVDVPTDRDSETGYTMDNGSLGDRRQMAKQVRGLIDDIHDSAAAQDKSGNS